MAVSAEYLAYVAEQLERVAPVTSRRMFGGVGLYSEGLFFGVIDDDVVYLKVDDGNRADYEAAGMRQFQPMPDAGPMQYYELPGDLLEDPDSLRPWVEKALAAARGARGRKRRKK